MTSRAGQIVLSSRTLALAFTLAHAFASRAFASAAVLAFTLDDACASRARAARCNRLSGIVVFLAFQLYGDNR